MSLSPLQLALKRLKLDDWLICWQGSLCDNAHPWIRADRIRLWAIHRRTDGWRACILAGVRPAAVIADRTPKAEDYRLMFCIDRDAVVITESSRRKGRHAWREQLQPGEKGETLTRKFWIQNISLPYSSDPGFRIMETALATYSRHEAIHEASEIPIPELVLVGGKGTKVYNRNSEVPLQPFEEHGRELYWASEAYGQGVLAAKPAFPIGHWHHLTNNIDLTCDLPELYVDLIGIKNCD